MLFVVDCSGIRAVNIFFRDGYRLRCNCVFVGPDCGVWMKMSLIRTSHSSQLSAVHSDIKVVKEIHIKN